MANEKPKTIVDVYKEYYGQLIVLISGLSGSGKGELGGNISRDFKMGIINTKNYYDKTHLNKTLLPNGKEILDQDTDDIVVWEKLNRDVNEEKLDGIIVVGDVFPTNKLKFIPDYHIHLKVPKQILKQKRTEYVESHKDANIDLETEMLRINMYTYPYYINVFSRMKIDKLVNITDKKPTEIYDEVFESLIKHINDRVYDPTHTLTKHTSKEYNIKGEKDNRVMTPLDIIDSETTEKIRETPLPFEDRYFVEYSNKSDYE